MFARISIEISLVFENINELNSEPACENRPAVDSGVNGEGRF